MSRKEFIAKYGNTAYAQIHQRMRSMIPKPMFCMRCNVNMPHDMSNNSGDYHNDVTDWEWICRSCHFKKDRAGDTSFIHPTIQELGIEKIFEKRNLNLDLFKLLIKARFKNTQLVAVLSTDYQERMGKPIKLSTKAIKRYRGLL